MALVYRHRRLDTNEIFYVGIGKEEKRAFTKNKRNIIWHNIVNKAGYKVEIIAEDLTWEDACELEIFLISEYGKRIDNTGTLCNITDGGDGTLGIKRIGENNGMFGKSHSEETKLKIAFKAIGRKYSNKSNLLKGKKNGDHPSAKKIINTLTNEIFDCAKDAAKEYNFNYSTLISKLNGARKNNTNLKYK